MSAALDSFDPVGASREIAARYRRYLRTMFYFRDPELRASFEAALDGWTLEKGPYLEATPVYRRTLTVSEVLAEVLGGEVDADLARAVLDTRQLFSHQEEAIRRLAAGRNVVVATGTGSGKTEAYLLPILCHLLREQRAGERSPGVRALVLYPMNALANDQRRRLGEIHDTLEKGETAFRFSFGRYTGETPEDSNDDYRKARQQLRDRLSGELILREEIRQRPPDILLSNYSMLEYLLLRPKETPLFDDGRGATWRFLVLDEAHQYRGAKGMEIAMLLRRLKRRVREGGHTGFFQCIATSASLGAGERDRDALAAFAAELFGEPFEPDDILTGEEVGVPAPESGAFRIEPATLLALADSVRQGDDAVCARVLAGLPGGGGVDRRAPGDARAHLYAVLGQESRGLELRSLLREPRLVEEAGSRVFPDVAEEERVACVSALADLLVRAEHPRTKAPLLSCRYHTFLRGLEGAFIRYRPRPGVSLARGDTADETPAFEAALCRECGQHYLVGRRDDAGRLAEAARDETGGEPTVDFYWPLDPAGADGEDGSHVLLCTACGALGRKGKPPREPGCGHSATIRLAPSEERGGHADQVRRCERCGYRAPDPVRELTHGTDGPNAVVATTLHQLLPEKRRKVLAFADGRQEAAFFAWYVEDTYKSIHGRVLLLRALRQICSHGHAEAGLHDLADELCALSAAAGEPGPVTERQRLKRAWVQVFRELLTDQPRLSLEGVGLLRWVLHLPPDLELPESLGKPPWSFPPEQGRDAVGALLDTLRADGAVELDTGGDVRVRWDELGLEARQSELAVGGRGAVKAWDGPKTRRVALMARLLEERHGARMNPSERVAAAQAVLREVWEAISAYRRALLLSPVRNGKRAQPGWWRARLVEPGDGLLRCSVCARLHTYSVGGICARYGCPGRLEPARPEDAGRGDHYRTLYQQHLPPELRAEEHTAQIAREQAREFQEDFEAGRIHLLSCSTTFELGIDLGDLDTIFLRNAPPEPFNYAQRVGRSGRRVHPGFAVTYCRRRPHDQAAFDDPIRLMEGRASAPRLRVTNDKIVSRHVLAVALSEFFRQHPERFEARVEGLLGHMETPTLVQDVERFLGERRGPLEARLDAIVPTELRGSLGLLDGTWGSRVGRALEKAVAEAAGDYQDAEAAQRQFIESEDFKGAGWAKERKKTIAGEDVISFLSRKAVIPKYGFPVDVVELDLQRTSHASTVTLQRDLAIAVAEFAPDAEVAANKQLWTSRGLKRVPGKAWGRSKYRKCREHGSFQAWPDGQDPPAPPCCGDAVEHVWVDPIFGFVAQRDGATALRGRPRRVLGSRPYFRAMAAGHEEEPRTLGHAAEVWRASPGYLVVLCEGRRGRGFRICPECGAGVGGQKLTREHEAPSGRRCRGTLESVALGHEFVTDVLRVRFLRNPEDLAPQDRSWFHHSLAYALFHGAAEVLEVPRQDLNVTVRSVEAGGHEIVLYDAVPGGAGLVARLEEDEVFRGTLEAARARVDGCSGCGPDASCYGCLRHYGNQFAHPWLKRGPVARFLGRTLEEWR
jgi:ATP-dependent helicase YprA (DUF1998 family)